MDINTQVKIDRLTSRINTLIDSLALANGRIAELEDRMSRTERERIDDRASIEALQAEAAELNEAHDSLKSDFTALDGAIDQGLDTIREELKQELID